MKRRTGNKLGTQYFHNQQQFIRDSVAAEELAENSNVQDAFVIAVEQQARERLEKLSALRKIKPVDMTTLSQQVGLLAVLLLLAAAAKQGRVLNYIQFSICGSFLQLHSIILFNQKLYFLESIFLPIERESGSIKNLQSDWQKNKIKFELLATFSFMSKLAEETYLQS